MGINQVISTEELFGQTKKVTSTEELFGLTPTHQLKAEKPDIATQMRMQMTEESAKGFAKPSVPKVAMQNIGELLTGFGSGGLLGIPESTGMIERPAKEHWTQDLSYGIGSFIGFAAGAPIKLGGMGYRLLSKPAGKAIAKIAPKLAGKKFVSRIAGNIASKAGTLGLASAISDIADLKGMPQRAASGAVFGTIFGVTGLANFEKKAPFINQLIRNATSRGLGASVGMYDPKIVKQIYDGVTTGKVTPDLAQSAFDELLFTWFSRKSTTPKELFRDIQKINTEAVKAGLQVKLWSPYDHPVYSKVMKGVPADFIVNGRGEAIPVKLFHKQPTVQELIKMSRPEIKPIPKQLPEAMKPEMKKPVAKKPPVAKPLERKVVSPEEMARRYDFDASKESFTKEMEAIEKRVIARSKKKVPTKKVPEEELKEFHSGLHLPKMLSELDRHLENKYGIRTEPVEKREVNKIITDASNKERKRVWGFKFISNLDRMGIPGKKLKDMSISYIKNRAQMEQVDLYKLRNAYTQIKQDSPISKKVIHPAKTVSDTVRKIYDLMEGKSQPSTPNEKAALKTLDEVRSRIAARAKKNDIKVITPFGEREFVELKNYAPVRYEEKGLRQFIDSDKFPHLRDKYIEKIAKRNFPELYNNAETKQKALDNAKKSFEEFRNDLKTRPSGHLERPRILDESILKELEAEWKTAYPKERFPLVRDYSFQSLSRWIVESNERLAWIESFGKDVNVGKGTYIPKKLQDMRYDFTKSVNKQYVDSFFSRYLNQLAPLENKTTRTMRLFRTVQLTKLAFAFIPNSLQWFTNTVPRVSLKTSGKAFWDLVKYSGVLGKKAKENQREFFARSGATTFKKAFSLAMMEEPGKVSALADVFLKTHGFSGTEFFNALFSAQAGKHHAIRMSEKLYKGKGKSYRFPFYRAELKKLGLSDERMKVILEQGPLVEADLFELADAAFHMRRTTQFLADAFHLPKTWSTPTGKLITQFKNFAYNQTSMLYNEPVKEAYKFFKSGGRQGDINKMIKSVATLSLAGALITELKRKLYPKIGIHFYEELMAGKSWPFHMMMYVVNSGGLGIASDIALSVGFGKAGLTSLVGGPTISDMSNFFEATANSIEEINTSIKYGNAKYLKHRSKTIAAYWQKFAAKVSPDVRIVIQNLFKDYKNIKTSTNWTTVVTDAYRKYKELYKLKSPGSADQFWNAFMQTQGKEYMDIFKKTPKKPTPKEIENWWKEQGKHPGERVSTPGEARKITTPMEYWY